MAGKEPCHNCRRQRLKCDSSLPGCQKCTKRGQQCLGYGRLLRWEPGVASRGKMAGLTYGQAKQHSLRDDRAITASQHSHVPSESDRSRSDSPILPLAPLNDPLIQDLGPANRMYLSYYASNVCKDLVLYDTPLGNPFRDLASMTQAHPMLLHVIVATAALRMSNASLKVSAVGMSEEIFDVDQELLRTQQCQWSVIRKHEPYRHALVARQRALCSLRHALMDRDSANTDVTLATVLLFTEFELLESGRDTWKHHVSGARQIIGALWKQGLSEEVPMSPLRSCLISNCLVYDFQPFWIRWLNSTDQRPGSFDIIGSTLTGSTDFTTDGSMTPATLSLLQDAEGNHCSSFPAKLLDLVQKGAQLLREGCNDPSNSVTSIRQQAPSLLKQASTFDPIDWAGELRSRSPQSDCSHREHIAFAHRAAACIYLARVALSIDATLILTHDFEAFVTDIVHHLSFVRPGDELLTASTWPAFIAGAETCCEERRAWVTQRFDELWAAEPWGSFRGALEVLEGIWKKKDRRHSSDSPDDTQMDTLTDKKGSSNWLGDLRTMGADWLII